MNLAQSPRGLPTARNCADEVKGFADRPRQWTRLHRRRAGWRTPAQPNRRELEVALKLDRRADRFFTGKAWRVGTAALLIWTTIFEPISAQTPTPQPPAADQPPTAQTPAKVYALSDLEYLLGPVALYPDPLLTLILQASAFPLQVVEADQWIADNQEAVQKGDFSEVDRRPWDSSVQALTRFPDVIAMLADHLDWTETLGMAFSSQAEDVANVIQLLRAKAEDAGNLKSTP